MDRLRHLGVLFMLSVNFAVVATESGSSDQNDTRYLICTEEANDHALKGLLDPSVVALNLENASGLKAPVSLFQSPLPTLKYLKLKFQVDDILKVLPEAAPNLEILDISGTNIFDFEVLSHLNRMPSLRILDMSKVHVRPDIPEIIDGLLNGNNSLTLYIKSAKKMSLLAQKIDLSQYNHHPRVVLTTYLSSVDGHIPLLENTFFFIY